MCRIINTDNNHAQNSHLPPSIQWHLLILLPPPSPDAIHMYHHLIRPCVLLCSGLFCHQVFPFIVSLSARVRHSCESSLGAKLSDIWMGFFFLFLACHHHQLDTRMRSLCFVKYNCRVKDEGTNLREGSRHIKRVFYERILVNYFILFNLCVMFPFWKKKKCYREKKQNKKKPWHRLFLSQFLRIY